MTICSKCDVLNAELVSCDKCASKLCQDCTQLTSTELRAVSLKRRLIFYWCPECTENEKTQKSPLATSSERSDFEEKIAKHLNNLQAQIANLHNDLAILKDTNIDLIKLLDNSNKAVNLQPRQQNMTGSALQQAPQGKQLPQPDKVKLIQPPPSINRNKQPQPKLTKQNINTAPTENNVEAAAGNNTTMDSSPQHQMYTKSKASGIICSGPSRPNIRVANPNIGEKVPELAWIYLSNLSTETETGDLLDILDSEYRHLCRCIKLRSKFRRPRSASFKLGVPKDLEERHLSASFWPKGFYVDKYISSNLNQNRHQPLNSHNAANSHRSQKN